MSDLIKRSDAIDALKALRRCECRERDPGCWEDACDAIKALPSADAISKKELIHQLRSLEPFNSAVPEWVYKVIRGIS